MRDAALDARSIPRDLLEQFDHVGKAEQGRSRDKEAGADGHGDDQALAAGRQQPDDDGEKADQNGCATEEPEDAFGHVQGIQTDLTIQARKPIQTAKVVEAV